MRLNAKQASALILLSTFLLTSSFVLLYNYPIGSRPAPFLEGPSRTSGWTGGTIPDEDGYFGWAQIYFETGKQYVYLEDIGPDKVASVDFFLGSNRSTSLFSTYTVLPSEEEKNLPWWIPSTRDIAIEVQDGNDEGLGYAHVHLVKSDKLGTQEWNLTADGDGTLLFKDAPPGFYEYEVITPLNPDHPLIQKFATDYPNLDYPIVLTAEVVSMSSVSATVKLHVDHYANPNLPNIPVFSKPGAPPICKTDENGDCLVDLPVGGKLFHMTAIKKNEGIVPPAASGIVSVNGRYAIANHWPPGYCYLIIPFWITGAIELITILLLAITMVSTFFLARRFASLGAAVASSVLTATCGLGITMMYSRGMADYASMAFATVGITLFVESLQDWKKYPRYGRFLGVVLGIFGGLSLGYSVTIRYSTVVVILGPLVYFLLMLEKGKSGWRRLLPKKSSFLRILVKVAPFLAGLALVGALLASYNASLFGGPFNSGYQMSTRAVFDPQTGNLTISQPEKTMLESYFHPSWQMFGNIFGAILPLLFFLIPLAFMAPLSLWQERKRKETWLLFFWLLPVYVIYMQMTWVGHMYEDARYFLPVLPPTAILVSFSLDRNFSFRRGMWPAVILIILLAKSGFFIADYCIRWQLSRLTQGMRGLTFHPPAVVIFLAASALAIFYGGVLYRKYFSRKSRWNGESGPDEA